MQFVYSLALISAMVFGVLYYLRSSARRKQKASRISGKILLYSLGVTIVLFGISIAFPSSSTDSASSTDENSTTSASSSSNKSSSQAVTENDVLSNYSTKELKAYNSGLIDSLDEDQGYANDGKDKYTPSLYIDTLGFNNRGLVVKVTSEFTSLDKDSKTVVGQYAQKLANTQVVLQGDDVTEESTPTTQIYYGAKKIGHSKLTNGTEFKWEKS